MAITATSVPSIPHEEALRISGALVAAVDLHQQPSTYQPPDHVSVFRDEHSWTLVLVTRTERWDDAGHQDLQRCHARVVSVGVASIGDLADRVRGRYGETGWRCLLDAGNDDPDLFRAWVPGAIERELEAARFFRDDLVPSMDRFTSADVNDLVIDIGDHLRVARFRVVAVDPPNRPTRLGENLVVAQAVVRKYGREVDVIIRMDCAGEVYLRVADEQDTRRQVIREVEDDDG